MGSLRPWDVRGRRFAAELVPFGDVPWNAPFAIDGDTMVVAAASWSRVCTWRLPKGEALVEFDLADFDADDDYADAIGFEGRDLWVQTDEGRSIRIANALPAWKR